MPQPWHHLSYYTPGLGPGAQGCPSLYTISSPVISILANHPPSSLDWHRSPGYTPWWGTGLYNWLHDAASNACRNHNPSPIPSLDHIYDFSSEFSWCWHWIQHNVGLCCLLLDMVNTGGNKLGNLSHTLNSFWFCGVYCPMDHFHPYMSQMKPTMSFIIITHDQNFFSENWSKFFFQRVPPLHEKVSTMNIYFIYWSLCSAIINFFHVL